MKTTVTMPETWKRVLEVEIPAEDFSLQFRSKLGDYKKKANLPGFRTGKVPEKIIEQRYGEAIKGEVVESLIEKSFKAACEEHKINPIARGSITQLKADEGQPISFTIETEVDPEIDIKGYDTLKVRPKPKKIKKGDVNEAIADLRERLSEMKDVERKAEKGDFVTIEYAEVMVDGEVKTGITSPSYPIELGKSQIKDFDKGIIGAKAGEIVDVEIKFPNDYADTELAGKKTQMKIDIKKVQEKVLLEVNEEFFKKLGDFTTEEALREKISKDLQERENERARQEAFTKAMDTLIEKNKFDVPPSRMEAYYDGALEEAQKYARAGQPVPTREELVTKYKDSAMHAMKRYRIIDFIAAKENIKPTQEEVDAEIQKISAYYQQPFEQVKETFRRNGTVMRIRADLREQKTLNFLLGEIEMVDDGE